MTARTVTLIDGARIVISRSGPMTGICSRMGLSGSPESRYRRFLSPTPRLSLGTLAYLTDVDHHDHEALVALDREAGEGVGVARYVCNSQDRSTAEVAVAVTDDWQGRGVGTALLALLIDRAREEDVRCFSALILADNRPMLALLRNLASPHLVDREGGAVEMLADLPPEGLGNHLGTLLRHAARGHLTVVPIRPPATTGGDAAAPSAEGLTSAAGPPGSSSHAAESGGR